MDDIRVPGRESNIRIVLAYDGTSHTELISIIRVSVPQRPEVPIREPCAFIAEILRIALVRLQRECLSKVAIAVTILVCLSYLIIANHAYEASHRSFASIHSQPEVHTHSSASVKRTSCNRSSNRLDDELAIVIVILVSEVVTRGL